MAINELSQQIHLHIDHVPRAPPPEDTPDKEIIYPQMPNLTCTPDLTKMRGNGQIVGEGNAGGKSYFIATGLYNNHCKYSEKWNPCHLSRSAHDN